MEIPDKELDLLALRPNEKEIILAISKMGKSVAMISRHTQIPRATVLYTLRKLKEKTFVFTVTDRKRKFWRSNIPKILLFLKNLQNRKEKTD